MKKFLFFIILFGVYSSSKAQETKAIIIEKRAREMQRVIGVNDPVQWKKFIEENYTQALINKPMRAKVSTDDGSTVTNSETTAANNLTEKVNIFQRLHDDFGEAKIVLLKTKDDDVEMVLLGEMGLKGTFRLKFDQAKPYLISSFGIEAGN